MVKVSVAHKMEKLKKAHGEAHEIISIMAILCVQAIEHRNTRFFRYPSTITNSFKGKNFLEFIKESYAHDKDLKILADNFEVFLRVIEKVATRK